MTILLFSISLGFIFVLLTSLIMELLSTVIDTSIIFYFMGVVAFLILIQLLNDIRKKLDNLNKDKNP